MIRVNTLLVFAARRRSTGGNVHRLTALIQGYEIAVQVATDRRCRDRKGARRLVARAESALEEFCWGRG